MKSARDILIKFGMEDYGVRTKSIWTKSIVYTQTKSIGYRTKSISHIFLYKHLCDIYLSNMNCISVIFQYFKAFFTLQDSVRDFCTHICFNVGLGINIIWCAIVLFGFCLIQLLPVIMV